jgi:chromosome segregation ATPase
MSDWLESHADLVAAVLAEIETLRAERAELRKRIRDLDAELGEATAVRTATERWEKERRTLRQRVRRLADSLEKALG